MTMWMRWVACVALAWAGAASAAPTGIEAEMEEDGFELLFEQAMAVLDNAPVPEVSLSPSMPMTCTWTDDHALGCMLDGERTLPAASRIEIRIARGLVRADGTPLGALRWTEETSRPALSAWITSWTNGVPVIRIESNAPTTIEAVRRVLELRVDGRVWRDLAVTATSIKDDGTPAAFAITLPADLPTDAVVTLHARAGLVSTAGPLPSTKEDVLLTFRHAEAFAVRRASCPSRVRDAGEDRDPRDGITLACVAGEDLRLSFSAPLDAASKKAFAARLPKAVRVAGWQDLEYGGVPAKEPQVPPGSAVRLRADAPDTDIAFVIDGALHARDGAVLARPVTVSIRNGAPQPALVADGQRMLLARPGNAMVELVNAPALDIDETRLDAAAARIRFGLPATRDRQTAYISRTAHAALAKDGWVRWRPQTGRDTPVDFAAPAFDLSAQVAPDAVLAWAVDWRTSHPVAGAQVELLLVSLEGATQFFPRGRIGADGLASLRLPAAFVVPERKPGVTSPTWVLRATAGTRRAVLPLGDVGDAANGLGQRTREQRVFAVTDRPLYRAGDHVRFRGWLREPREGRLLAPVAPKTFELGLVSSGNDRPIARLAVTPDAEGAFTGEFVLPSQTVDGDYCLVQTEGWVVDRQACVFVGTFRPQDLWIETASETPLLRAGDPLRLRIAAGYFSGGPAAGVPVSDVHLRAMPASPADAYPLFADYTFARDDARPEVRAADEAARARPALDAEGHAQMDVPVAFVPDAKRPPPPFARIDASVQVTLAGREPVPGKPASVWYAAFDRYIGLKIEPAWFDATTPLRLDAVAIDAAGKALPGTKIDVVVERLGQDDATPPQQLAQCTLVAGTPADCEVPRKRSGVYRFTARSGDAVPATIERYVWNADDAQIPDSLPTALTVVEAPTRADAPVRLRVQQPYAHADAWVVLASGGEVLDSRILPLDGPDTTFTLATHADGRRVVKATVRIRERRAAGIDGRGLRAAPRALTLTASIDVPRADRPHALALETPTRRTPPGATVRLRLRNTGTAPRTVALAVFDDALHALAGDRWNAFDPQGDAWQGTRDIDWRRRVTTLGFDDWCSCGFRIALPWEDGTLAQDTRTDGTSPVLSIGRATIEANGLTAVGDVLFGITASDGGALREASAPDAFGYSGGAQLDSVVVTGGGRLRDVALATAGARPDPALSLSRASVVALVPSADARALYGARLRDTFPETALWQPALVLAPGESREITLVAPDNLTRWRAVAWAADASEGFERIETTFEVGQPLEVRLQAPVRMYPDDRAVLVANVRREGDAATVEAALQVDALGAANETSLSLEKAGQGAIALAIAPDDGNGAPRTVQVVAAARAGDDADAAAQSIELASPTIETHRSQASWLGTAPLRLVPPTLPPGATDPRRRITLLPGVDALAHGWIDALHAYPHRCWEQMLSRAVGAAIALERGEGDRFPDARATLDDALRNVPVFQNADGSFRYFADAFDDGGRNADVALTAWSVRGLRFLRTLGHAVPDAPLQAADGFLVRYADNTREDAGADDARIDAGVLLALALASRPTPPRAAVDRLWSQFPSLPLVARVATARAMAATAHPQARSAVDALLAQAARRDDVLSLHASVRADRWMSSDLREQCELLALLREHPALADLDVRRRLLAGLGDLQAGGVDGVDTQAAAGCLIALRGVEVGGSTATLDIAQGTLRTQLQLTPAARAPTLEQSVDARDLRKPLQLTPSIEGEVPASVIVDYTWQEDVRRAASSAIGFALQRRYATLRDGRWVPLAGAGLRDGDWVRVTLVLDNAATRYFVAITDAVPGGLRPTDLSLAGVAGVDVGKVSDPGDGWFATRRLDPRAPKFYAEFLPPGRHEVHYFARVGNAGDYLAPPATAELMYGEATRARTVSTRIVIAPARGDTGP